MLVPAAAENKGFRHLVQFEPPASTGAGYKLRSPAFSCGNGSGPHPNQTLLGGRKLLWIDTLGFEIGKKTVITLKLQQFYLDGSFLINVKKLHIMRIKLELHLSC